MPSLAMGLTLSCLHVWDDGGTAPETNPAQINVVSVGALAGGGALPVALSAQDTPDGAAIYWVLVPSTQPAPSATDVRHAQTAGGGTPTESGQGTWPGPFSETLMTGIPRGSYVLYVVIDTGVLSNVGSSAPFTVDTAAAILSGASAIEAGSDAATLSVVSDDTIGTLYAGIWPMASVPSAQEVMTGAGAVYHTALASPVAGANTVLASGLEASTLYRAYFVQEDDFGNLSNLAVSGDVSLSNAGLALSFVNAGSFEFNRDDPIVVDLSTVQEGTWLILAGVQNGINTEQMIGLNLEGSGATVLANSPGTPVKQGFFKIQCPAAAAGNNAAEITMTLSGNGVADRQCAAVWAVDQEPQLGGSGQDEDDVSPYQADASFTTTAGRSLVVASGVYTPVATEVGFDRDALVVAAGQARHIFGSASGLGDEMRSISLDASARVGMLAIEIYPV